MNYSIYYICVCLYPAHTLLLTRSDLDTPNDKYKIIQDYPHPGLVLCRLVSTPAVSSLYTGHCKYTPVVT